MGGATNRASLSEGFNVPDAPGPNEREAEHGGGQRVGPETRRRAEISAVYVAGEGDAYRDSLEALLDHLEQAIDELLAAAELIDVMLGRARGIRWPWHYRPRSR